MFNCFLLILALDYYLSEINLYNTKVSDFYFGSLKPQIFMYSRWRDPPKTVSPRPYCRSRRGRDELGSETIY